MNAGDSDGERESTRKTRDSIGGARQARPASFAQGQLLPLGLICLWLSGFVLAMMLEALRLKLSILAVVPLSLVSLAVAAFAVLMILRTSAAYTPFKQDNVCQDDSGLAVVRQLEEDLLLKIQEAEVSERKFQLLCDMAPLGIFMTDETNAGIYSNCRLQEIGGQTLEEGCGFNWLEIIHPDDRQWLFSQTLAAVYEGKEYSMEYRIVNPAGVCRWVRGLGRPLLGADGSVTGYVGTIEDITDRKIAELSNQRLAAIVEYSHDAIIASSASGIIESFNAAAISMFGYRLSEVLGLKFSALFPESCHALAHSIVQAVEKGEIAQEREVQVAGKDGRIIDVSMTVSPVGDLKGGLPGVSIILRDISQRKEMEKRISEFYSTVSHELRTPLTSIRGALSLIDEGIVKIDSDSAVKLIKVARTSSVRLVRLVNDILDLRKIEAGKLELHCQTLAAKTLAESAIESMQAFACQMNVGLSLIQAPSVSVHADADRITQVLSNLIQNAIKFSPEGASVQVAVEVGGDGAVVFAISDQGAGICAEEQKKLFSAFQQLDSSDSRSAEGTGLGLAISRAIVHEHGGQIGVESQVGRGSTFWFAIPLAPEQEAGKPAAEADENKQAVAASSSSSGVFVGSYQKNLNNGGTDMVAVSKEFLSCGTKKASQKELVEQNTLVAATEDSVVALQQLDSQPVVSICQDADPASMPGQACLRASDSPCVLIVEDDSELSETIAINLSQAGYYCLRAYDRAQALEILSQCCLDAVVLDLVLPDGSGFDVIESLQVDGLQSSIPVIVITGTRAREQEYGTSVFDWLAKPFEIENLHAAVDRAVVLPRRRRVLVIDADAGQRAVIQEQLKALPVQCRAVGNGVDAIDLAMGWRPDVIVLEVGLPHLDGFEVVRVLQKDGRLSGVPLIVYSAEELSSSQRQRLTLGLTRFLTKGKTSEEALVDSVRGLVDSVVCAQEPSAALCEHVLDEAVSGNGEGRAADSACCVAVLASAEEPRLREK